jgi:N-acetylneuraminic acid mutarotase
MNVSPSPASKAHFLLIATFLSVLSACSGGGGGAIPPPVTYTATSGVAQKGPLIKGSTVTAQELDAKLSPTGKQYSYQITSDLGTFSPTSTFGSQYVGLNATGYYFDEIANVVSTGTVTLNGYSDLTTGTVLNVNLLTTLAYQRIQHLVTTSNMTFAAALTQAEKEVLAALNIPSGSYGSFGTLDISGNTDGDHILEAISSIFVYGNSSGSLSQLIAAFQSDIGANGMITNPSTTAALTAAAEAINPTAVAANLTQKYASAGLIFTAANISEWVAQSGDGVIGKFVFEMADATPSSVFTFPSFVVSQFAGIPVAVTAGQLSVNGTPTSGSVSFKTGDVVTLSPNIGNFPNGVLTTYLVSGAQNLAKVSFTIGLISIAVTPNTPSVPAGFTQQFVATGTYSDTSTAILTDTVSWASVTAGIAKIDASSGLAEALTVGTTGITATLGSVSGSATLNVTASVANSWSPAASLTDGRSFFTATPLSNGMVLAAGGLTPSGINSAELYDPSSDSWSSANRMPVSVGKHTATLLPSGKVLVAGGTDNLKDYTYNNAELYDFNTNGWTAATPMAAARQGHTATLLPSGKVLVAGGFDGGPGSVGGAFATAELYDPVANTWSAAASMSVGHAAHTATLLPNGKVLVAGGDYPATDSAELYDPVANTWSSAGTMGTDRTDHTATLLQNGKVLVAGGYASTGTGQAVSTAEIYDPVANTWSPAGGMSTARSYHTATLLPSGTVLVTGGTNTVSGISATAELYDPVANAWSPAATMSIARAYHTATLLRNGTVLAAGGDGGSNAAELYHP